MIRCKIANHLATADLLDLNKLQFCPNTLQHCNFLLMMRPNTLMVDTLLLLTYDTLLEQVIFTLLVKELIH